MHHPLRSSAIIGRAIVAVVLALTLAGATAPAATADDDTDAPEIRWSVEPADENGPDGRSAVEHDLDPGETVSEHFAVRNVSEEEVTFRLTAADGFYTRTGRFDILPADQESVDSGTWIELPEEVTVAAGETVVVPFEITVPETAEPGDHAAGITASILSVQSGEDGASVGVESRVGFRVLSRVTGELTPAASVQINASTYDVSWNPLRPGETTVTFEIANEGNTRLLAAGTVASGTGSAEFPAGDERRQELLPGDTRELTVVVDGVWPLFIAPTSVTVVAESVTMDGSSAGLEPVRSETVTWAVPWPQLIIIAGLALLIIALVWGRRRSKRKLETMLEDAREEGRRSSATDDAS